MALNITINKVSVAASFAAGATVATAVASGGTAPYVYSLATGGDKFAINSSTGVVTTIAAMDINNIASFSVTATDSTTGTALTGTSSVTYPPIQAAIQNRFNKANVIYKITKDINLEGGTLTIPAGCTLDFQGGSFTNGTIVGNNTKIKAGLEKIFNTNIILSKSWNVSEVYPDWFGAKGDGLSDDRLSVQKAIDFGVKFHVKVHIKKPKNYYLLNSYNTSDRGTTYCLKISQGVIIEGDGYLKQMDGNAKFDFYLGQFINPVDTIILLEGEPQVYGEYRLPNVRIKQLSFMGTDKEGTGRYADRGIYTPFDDSLTASILELVTVCGLNKSAYDLSGFGVTLINCSAWFSKNGFIVRGRTDGAACTSFNFMNCSVMNSPGDETEYGFLFNNMTYCNLITCAVDGTTTAYCINNSYGINLIGCGNEVCSKAIEANTWCQSVVNGFTTILSASNPYDILFDLKASFGNTFNGLGILGNRPSTIIEFDQDCNNNDITDWQLKHDEITITLREGTLTKDNIAYKLNGSYFDRQNLFGKHGNRLSEGMRYLSSGKKSEIYLGNDLWTNIIQSSEFSKIQTYKITVTDSGELAAMTSNVFSFNVNGKALPLNATIINASQSTYDGLIIGKITLSSLKGGYINLINLSSSAKVISNLEITLVVGDNNTGV